jgi:hypothetical protein
VTKIISVGNPNRLVKLAREKSKCDDFAGYFFNSATGEIIEGDSLLNANDYICMLIDSRYPVYEGKNYIGYICDGKFISPDGVLQGYVNTAQETKVRKNREKLRELICSRFR